jgi:hypothetical protein
MAVWEEQGTGTVNPGDGPNQERCGVVGTYCKLNFGRHEELLKQLTWWFAKEPHRTVHSLEERLKNHHSPCHQQDGHTDMTHSLWEKRCKRDGRVSYSQTTATAYLLSIHSSSEEWDCVNRLHSAAVCNTHTLHTMRYVYFDLLCFRVRTLDKTLMLLDVSMTTPSQNNPVVRSAQSVLPSAQSHCWPEALCVGTVI